MKMKKILKLFPADKKFTEMFEREKERLGKILDAEVAIEHVGSTAVSELGGKGIIDMVIGVPNSSDLEGTAKVIAGMGYYYDLDNEMGGDRIFLASREHDSTLGDYHIHIVVKGSDEWKRFLLFRDRLRNDVRLKDEYMGLKEKIMVETGVDREKYKRLKSKFIEQVIKENI